MDFKKLVIPLPKRRKVTTEREGPEGALNCEKVHMSSAREQMTSADLVSMYLPTPDLPEELKNGDKTRKFQTMLRKVLSKKLVSDDWFGQDENHQLFTSLDNPVSVVSGWIILESQETPFNCLPRLRKDEIQALSVTDLPKDPIGTIEAPLLLPWKYHKESFVQAVLREGEGNSFLNGSASVMFDVELAKRIIDEDMIWNYTLEIRPKPSSDLWFEQILDLDKEKSCLIFREIPLIQTCDGNDKLDDIRSDVIISRLSPTVNFSDVDIHDVQFPTFRKKELFELDCDFQKKGSFAINPLDMMDVVIRSDHDDLALKTVEEPLLISGMREKTTLTISKALRSSFQSTVFQADEVLPSFLKDDKMMMKTILENDMRISLEAMPRLNPPELPESLVLTKDLSNPIEILNETKKDMMKVIPRECIELKLHSFWASKRMISLIKYLCISDVTVNVSHSSSRERWKLNDSFYSFEERRMITINEKEEIIVLKGGNEKEVNSDETTQTTSKGRLSTSPLDNYMRLRGFSSRVPVETNEKSKMETSIDGIKIPITLQPFVTNWHIESFKFVLDNEMSLLVVPPLTQSLAMLFFLFLANSSDNGTIILCDSDERSRSIQKWLHSSCEKTGFDWERKVKICNSMKEFVVSPDQQELSFVLCSVEDEQSGTISDLRLSLVKQIVSTKRASHVLLVSHVGTVNNLQEVMKTFCGIPCFGTPLQVGRQGDQIEINALSDWNILNARLYDTELEVLSEVKKRSESKDFFEKIRSTLLWGGPKTMLSEVMKNDMSLFNASEESSLSTLYQELDAGVLEDHFPLLDAVVTEITSNPPVLGSKTLIVVNPEENVDWIVNRLKEIVSKSFDGNCHKLTFGCSGNYECNCYCGTTTELLKKEELIESASECIWIAYLPHMLCSRESLVFSESLNPLTRKCVVVVGNIMIHMKYGSWWRNLLSDEQNRANQTITMPKALLKKMEEPKTRKARVVFCSQHFFIPGHLESIRAELNRQGFILTKCGNLEYKIREGIISEIPILVTGRSSSLAVLIEPSLTTIQQLTALLHQIPEGISKDLPLFSNCTLLIVSEDLQKVSKFGIQMMNQTKGRSIIFRYATNVQSAAVIIASMICDSDCPSNGSLTKEEQFLVQLGYDPLSARFKLKDKNLVSELVRDPRNQDEKMDDQVESFMSQLISHECKKYCRIQSSSVFRPLSSTERVYTSHTPSPNPSKTDCVIDRIMSGRSLKPLPSQPLFPTTPIRRRQDSNKSLDPQITLGCCLPRGASHGQTRLCWVPSPTPTKNLEQKLEMSGDKRDSFLQRITDYFSYKED